jgi:hypothetical protein
MKGAYELLIPFSDILAIDYTILELGPLPRSELRKNGISTQRQCYSTYTKYVAPLEFFQSQTKGINLFL